MIGGLSINMERARIIAQFVTTLQGIVRTDRGAIHGDLERACRSVAVRLWGPRLAAFSRGLRKMALFVSQRRHRLRACHKKSMTCDCC
jgi:hypothetical protein